MTGFIDFYNSHNILPVHLGKVDFETFIQNRLNLYNDLGIPITLLKNKKLLEFGPGGGYNARLLLMQNPSKYAFVDASKLSIDLIPKIIFDFSQPTTEVQIIEKLFLEFESSEKFDYVIAEACIPGQDDPAKTLKHISGFVDLGGILSITTTTKSSHLAEMLRSLITLRIKLESSNFNWILDQCVQLFESHLNTLPGKTRSIEDWVLDNLIQEIHKGKYDFNLFEAIEQLDGFVFLGSSPRFYKNYKWYKSDFSVTDRNKDAINQFASLELALLDYRIDPELVTETKENQKIQFEIGKIVNEIYAIIKYSLQTNSISNVEEIMDLLASISNILPIEMSRTKKSIDDFMHHKNFFYDAYSLPVYDDFRYWFGRGQQFFSFQKVSNVC